MLLWNMFCANIVTEKIWIKWFIIVWTRKKRMMLSNYIADKKQQKEKILSKLETWKPWNAEQSCHCRSYLVSHFNQQIKLEAFVFLFYANSIRIQFRCKI